MSRYCFKYRIPVEESKRTFQETTFGSRSAPAICYRPTKRSPKTMLGLPPPIIPSPLSAGKDRSSSSSFSSLQGDAGCMEPEILMKQILPISASSGFIKIFLALRASKQGRRRKPSIPFIIPRAFPARSLFRPVTYSTLVFPRSKERLDFQSSLL
jgi:hypothetical protein